MGACGLLSLRSARLLAQRDGQEVLAGATRVAVLGDPRAGTALSLYPVGAMVAGDHPVWFVCVDGSAFDQASGSEAGVAAKNLLAVYGQVAV